jgi:hypothetical protein
MRVSVCNCVSTAVEMMQYSDGSLFGHSGHDDFDYVVCKWLPTPEVNEYLEWLQREAPSRWPGVKVHVVEHETDESIGYVPNLRAMMNEAFDYGFGLNDYCGLTNTDVVHGWYWLAGLVDNARLNRVINSLHITAVPRSAMQQDKRGIIPDQNLGIPEAGKFDEKRFTDLFERYYNDTLIVAEPGDFRDVATMPYLFHRKWWEKCGPWDTVFDHEHQAPSPDECFFARIDAAGAEFAVTHRSIIYHAEGVERKRTRPPGAERLPEEGTT